MSIYVHLRAFTALFGAERRRSCALIGILLCLRGCGGGGGSGPISLCSLTAFTPNYAQNVAHLLTWPGFPVHVYFIQDANYTNARQQTALAGFNQWVTATGGALSYQVVSSAAAADITVKFDPTTPDGLTNLHFADLTMVSADMSIGIQNLPAADEQCVAAHEFGHALGIDGHSPQQGDLMYAVHVVGEPCPVTQRDLNTIKTGYCNIFARSALRGVPLRSGPIRTSTLP